MIKEAVEKVKAICVRSLGIVDDICAGVLVVVSVLLFASVIASAAYLVYLGALWLPNTLVFVVLGLVVAACCRSTWMLWLDLREMSINSVFNLTVATLFGGVAIVIDKIRDLIDKGE